ncbi:MAG TPA: type II toxin-antitoxin system VapC family toxin [Aquiluna sp.]
MTSFYLESSAAMKLFEPEQGSQELREWLMVQEDLSLVTSELTKLEVLGNLSKSRLIEARSFFEYLTLIQVKRSILDDAFLSMQLGLKALDAIHHATIRLVVEDLAGVISYDNRLNAAVRALGVRVISPAD